MQRLAAETQETVALSVRVGQQRVYIAQVESSRPVRRVVEINQLIPLHCGASGKVLLAWFPERVQADLIAQLPLPRFTERTITETDRLMEEVRAVYKAGYALSFGERVAEGAAVAVPVLTGSGRAVAALAVLAPRHRASEETLLGWLPMIRKAAHNISLP